MKKSLFVILFLGTTAAVAQLKYPETKKNTVPIPILVSSTTMAIAGWYL